jgi:hypothetical protein
VPAWSLPEPLSSRYGVKVWGLTAYILNEFLVLMNEKDARL